MSNRDVTALITNVLVAAMEPADKTLGLLFRHLIDHPGQLARGPQGPALLPAAIAETLRYTPPVQLIPRHAENEVVLAGTPIPAGATVFCMIGAANRDPDAFSAPDTFDIHRSDLGTARSFTAAAQHLSFGSRTPPVRRHGLRAGRDRDGGRVAAPPARPGPLQPGFPLPGDRHLHARPRRPSAGLHRFHESARGPSLTATLTRLPGPGLALDHHSHDHPYLREEHAMTPTDITRAINDLLFTPGLDLDRPSSVISAPTTASAPTACGATGPPSPSTSTASGP